MNRKSKIINGASVFFLCLFASINLSQFIFKGRTTEIYIMMAILISNCIICSFIVVGVKSIIKAIKEK